MQSHGHVRRSGGKDVAAVLVTLAAVSVIALRLVLTVLAAVAVTIAMSMAVYSVRDLRP